MEVNSQFRHLTHTRVTGFDIDRYAHVEIGSQSREQEIVSSKANRSGWRLSTEGSKESVA
jgi:hypothetical protein